MAAPIAEQELEPSTERRTPVEPPVIAAPPVPAPPDMVGPIPVAKEETQDAAPPEQKEEDRLPVDEYPIERCAGIAASVSSQSFMRLCTSAA